MLKSLCPINCGECVDQIQEKLHKAAPALRCTIDRNITSIASWNWSTGVFGGLVAANHFGREEDGGAFVFAQKDLDGLSTCNIRPIIVCTGHYSSAGIATVGWLLTE